MLQNKLEVSFMKQYLEDVRQDFPGVDDKTIVEDYVFCQLDCLIDESQLDFPVFIDSITKLFNTLYNDTNETKRIVDELTKQYKQ